LNGLNFGEAYSTVVLVYGNNPPDYEIEFMTDDFETIDVLTVKSSDIAKIEHW
jgi:hypothetical protein